MKMTILQFLDLDLLLTSVNPVFSVLVGHKSPITPVFSVAWQSLINAHRQSLSEQPKSEKLNPCEIQRTKSEIDICGLFYMLQAV
jgi:hypothetical protein